MNSRLKQIIQYKTGGRQNAFAELMGWTTPYLNKLLKGVSLGLQPVLTVLEQLPEIDARWFLTGQGSMLTTSKEAELRRDMFSYIQEVLELEKYLTVMTPEELRIYEAAVVGRKKPDFTPEMVREWEGRLNAHQQELDAKFAAVTTKSDKLCRPTTAKK